MTGYIYFLFVDRKIVYIGQTIDLIRRLKEYSMNAYFDDIRFIECPKNKLREYERRLINYFRPACNKHHNPSYKNATLHGKKRRKRLNEFEVIKPFLN